MYKNSIQKFLVILVMALVSFGTQAAATRVDLKQIKTEALTEKDLAWFIKEFPISYMSVYQDKTFMINGENAEPVILSRKNINEKEKWLFETAKDEFNNYVTKPESGYKAIAIQYKGKPIGALLYRLLDKEKVIYFAQFFIEPAFQKKGVGEQVLTDIVPALHPDYKRYEILARHQNDAAFLLYNKSGFTVGDVALVQKYNYDPLRYISFYKNLK